MSDLPKEVVFAIDRAINKFDADNLCAKMTDVRPMPGAAGGSQNEHKVWEAAPEIAVTVDGLDITGIGDELTQLSVPRRVNIYASRVFKVAAVDSENQFALNNAFEAGAQALNARINRECANVLRVWGSQVQTKATALSNFTDVVGCKVRLERQDVQPETKKSMLLNTSDYANMAGDLADKDSPNDGIVRQAFEMARVNRVADFETFSTSFTGLSQAAAGGGAITVTGAQKHIPIARTIDADDNPTNNDNRTQDLVVSSTVGVVAGDKFTIAGVNEVSLINKEDTGNLRTFTVVSIPAAGTIRMAPALVASDGGTGPEEAYANCTTSAAGGSAIAFLNTTQTQSNLFFEEGSLVISTAPVIRTSEQLGGLVIANQTSKLGFNIVIASTTNLDTMETKYRMTTFFGVDLFDPMKAGVLLGGQV